MRKPFLLFVFSFICILCCMVSCDDGDVITFELDFEDTFLACKGVNDLVLYKTKEDPSESISVLIPGYNKARLVDKEQLTPENNVLIDTITNTTLYYRTYSDASLPDNLFCSDIPPKININIDEESSCSLIISTRLIEDDDDGVPFNLEFDGDTDNDGLPDAIDADDDGDNVLTKDENPDPNGDGDLSDAQDTDNDGTPDYLDADDDRDGIPTRDEENVTQDKDPTNDITNSDVGPDYLNDQVSTAVPATAYRKHTISQTYTVSVSVTGVSLTTLSQDILDFGVLSDPDVNVTSGKREFTPKF